MTLTKTICTIILCLLINTNGKSQSASELKRLAGIFDQEATTVKPSTIARDNPNELQLLVSGLFLLYKTFISSQDMASCVFYPSCSVYAIKSIKKEGFILGAFSAFDRLTRCNPLSPEKYHIHTDTKLLYDPVP